jgi:hypothetical protein
MKLTPQSSIKFGASTRLFRLAFAPPKSETAEEWALRKAKEAETNKSTSTKTKVQAEQEPTADEPSNSKIQVVDVPHVFLAVCVMYCGCCVER